MVSLKLMIAIDAAVIAAILTIILLLYRRVNNHKKPSGNYEELFLQSTKSINEVFFVLSRDWKRVYYASPSYENLYHKKVEDLYKSPDSWLDSVHPDDRDSVKEKIKEFIANDRFTVFPDYRINNSDGTVRWISTRIFPVKMSNGIFERILGIAADITDSKISENELRRSEENYRNIITNIRDVFYRSNAEGKLIMISPSVTKVMGYDSVDECIGMDISKEMYYSPTDRDNFINLLKEKGGITDYETTLRRKDGSPVIVATSSHFYYDDKGNIAGIEGIVRDITERKRAEDMFNKAFFENPCPMSISDILSGIYIEVNKAWLDALEYDKNEVIGHSAPELRIYKNIEERDRIVESIKSTGHAHNFDIEFVSKTGKLRNALFFGDVIDVGGKKMLLSAVLNITEQRETEKLLKTKNDELAALNEELMAINEEFEAANEQLIAFNHELETKEEDLRESEEKYRNLIENLSAGMIIYDSDLKIIFSNQTANSLLGIEGIMIIGHTYEYTGWDIIFEDGTPVMTDNLPIQKTRLSGKAVKNSVLGIRIPGHTDPVWLLCDTYPVLDEEGKILQIVTTFIDLTARKLVEEEVERLKNYLNNIIDSNPDMFVGMDSEMRITLINRKTEYYSGVPVKDAIGMPLSELLGEFAPSIRTMKAEIVAHNPVSLHGLLIEKNGDKRYYDIMLYPLFHGGDEGAVIRIMDVTNIIKNEEQLRQAQKMETVGNLAGGLAHDFNNVLSGIVGTTSLIKHLTNKDENISDRIKNYIDLIDKSGKRAAEMVQQLLTLTRKSEVNLIPLNLNNALQNIVQICRNTFDKSIEIYTEYYPSAAMIKGDPAQVEQVLLNLCINASHALTIMKGDNDRQGGTLALSIKNIIADNYFCTVHPEASSGRYWMISHSDTGVGITADNLHKIFDPFFTTKVRERGTGLGLAMVYSIVHQHSGFIEVYSQPGVGSTFNIYFPEFSENGSGNSLIAEHVIEEGKGLILVIDDEEVVRQMAEIFLLECGYNVILAENGRDGISIYREKKDEIKCVLLDMAMPGMSGKDVYTELRGICPDVKVLLASGFRHDRRVQEALSIGINGFIQKPYSITELSRQIKKTIG